MNNKWSDEGIQLLRDWAARGYPLSDRPMLTEWMSRRPKMAGVRRSSVQSRRSTKTTSIGWQITVSE